MLNSYNSLTIHHLGSIAIAISDNDDDDSISEYYSLDQYCAACLFEVFLYGIYATLFAICIRILLRNKSGTRKVLIACAMTMFVLATVDVALELSFLFSFVAKGNSIPAERLHFKYLIYITSNMIADSLVIYRCHAVWNDSKRVIVIPCFLLLGGTACGYAYIGVSSEGYSFRQLLDTFLITTVGLNLLVTILMAGRIGWIARKARSILGPRLSSKYNTMIAIIVESGVIYSIYVVLDVVHDSLILDAGLAQVVGIVPTLIIVQIGLGRDAHDIDTTASMVRSDARGFTSTHDHTYDSPPTGPPPSISPLSSSPTLPHLTHSLTNHRTSRLVEIRPQTNEDEESGVS